MSRDAAIERAVRVFVSSTFRDMAAERERLASHAWPALRTLCESRAVTFTDVDLRWGITREQAERGDVLPICLAEIDASRPYFIAILGERYGWVPDEIPEHLVTQMSWLEEQQGKSVTELEIAYGVLNDPSMHSRAFFYFRDESASHAAGAVETDPRAVEMLAALKDRIRRCPGVRLREGFRTAEELAVQVVDDLRTDINLEFPADTTPDATKRDRLAHAAYAGARSYAYIERPEAYGALDEYLRGGGQPLVVTGDSGSGKSALLANWVARVRGTRPDVAVVEHYCGAGADAADWAAMCRRIGGELEAATGVELELPSNRSALLPAFRGALHRIPAAHKVVIVVDGLNQLEDREAAPDLSWLPDELPDNIRLVISTLPGRPLAEARRRGWAESKVGPLQQPETAELIRRYLSLYRQGLDEGLVQRIVATPQTANPLFVRILLDELRVVGSFERLGEIIDRYLEASGPAELYTRVLERWERDYESVRPALVADLMSALWAARRGLSETELLALLGTGGLPLPHAHASPLLLAAHGSVVARSGYLGFGHDSLRQAVSRRYLPDPESQKRAHAWLASWFEQQGGLSARKVDELPWQWMQAERWDRLHAMLSDIGTLTAIAKANDNDVQTYWAGLERRGYRSSDAYADLAPGPELDVPLRVLRGQGHHAAALRLASRWLDHARTTGRAVAPQLLVDTAILSMHAGETAQCDGLLNEAERLAGAAGDRRALATVHGTRGNLREREGQTGLDAALEEYQTAERLLRAEGAMRGAAAAINNQAWIVWRRYDPSAALRLFGEARVLFRDCGDLHGVALAEMGMGRVQAVTIRDYERADAHFASAESLLRRLGDRHGLLKVAGFMKDSIEFRGASGSEALPHLRDFADLCRELDFVEGLGSAVEQMLPHVAEPERAELIAQWESACRRRKHVAGLLSVLQRKVRIAFEAQRDDECVGLIGEWAQLSVDPSFSRASMAPFSYDGSDLDLRGPRVTGTFSHDALNLGDLAEPDRAVWLGAHVAGICLKHGDLDGWSDATMRIARTVPEEPDAAAILAEHERECEVRGHWYGLMGCLCARAFVLSSRGRFVEADELLTRVERICADNGDASGATSLAERRLGLLREAGEWERVLDGTEQHVRRCREAGEAEKLAWSLMDVADICARRLVTPRIERSVAALEEAQQLWVTLGERDEARTCLHKRASHLAELGRREEAMALLGDDEADCRRRGLQRDLAECLLEEAKILGESEGLERVSPLLDEYDRIAHQQDASYRLFSSMEVRSQIAERRGDPAAAAQQLELMERWCRESGNVGNLPKVHKLRAELAEREGDWRGQLEALRRQEEAFRERHEHPDEELVECLIAQVNASGRLGMGDEAARVGGIAAIAIDGLGWPDHALTRMRASVAAALDAATRED